MKKQYIIFMMLFFMFLGGCAPQGNGLCENKSYLDLLAKDESMNSFILDDVYYRLPSELKQFYDNGWTYITDDYYNKYELSTIVLKPNEGYEMILKKGDNTITVIVTNSTAKSMPIDENAPVTCAKFHSFKIKGTDNDDFIVLKEGIRLGTGNDEANQTLENFQDYKTSENTISLGNDFHRKTQINFENKKVESIYLMYEGQAFDYYKSDDDKKADFENKQQEKLKEIQQLIRDAEDNAKKYPIAEYEKLVKKIQMGQVKQYYAELTVGDKLDIVYSQAYRDLFSSKVLSLNDENGNKYALSLDEQFLEKLTKGQKVKVWGTMNVVEETNKVYFPIFNPGVVELDNEVIFNSALNN